MESLSLFPHMGRTVRPFLFSGLAFLLALLVREALTPLVGASVPHATFMVATAFSAWFFGLGPGVFTMILGLPAADYFFTLPVYSWSAFDRGELPSTIIYVVSCSALILMGVANRRRALELEEKTSQIAKQAAEVQLSNDRLRELSVRLLHTQDEERRHFARELHDGVGQHLAGLSILVGALKRGSSTPLPTHVREKLQEIVETVRACTSELRTISHLLHPPLLDELGLKSAVRWYVEGFADRSGIQVQIEIAEDFPRISADVELVVFRVLQESLTNVHRHSGSKVACVRIGFDAQQVWLEVADQGKGMSQGNQNAFRPGVGISGMRERIRDLSGTFELSSDSRGTLLKARIPLVPGPHRITDTIQPGHSRRRVS